MHLQPDPSPANDPESPHVKAARISNYIYSLDRAWDDEQGQYAWKDKEGGWHYTPNNWVANLLAIFGGLGLIGSLVQGDWGAAAMAALVLGAAGGFIVWQWRRYLAAKELYLRLRQEAFDLVPPGMHINPDGEYRIWGKK